MDYWGSKYVSMHKACGKLGGSGGGVLPQEVLVLNLLLGAIWWNLGLFCTNIIFTVYCVIKAFIIDLHVQ